MLALRRRLSELNPRVLAHALGLDLFRDDVYRLPALPWERARPSKRAPLQTAAPTHVRSVAGSASVSTTSTASLNASGGDLIVVCTCNLNNDTGSGVVFNGSEAFTEFDTGLADDSQFFDFGGRFQLWYRVAPTQTTANVVATWPSAVEHEMTVHLFSGADQTTPLVNLTTLVHLDGNETNSFSRSPASTPDHLIIAALATIRWDLSATSGASQTRLAAGADGAGGDAGWLRVDSKAGAASSTTVSFSFGTNVAATLYAFGIQAPAASGNTGTLSATLPAPTLAAAGTLRIAGSASATAPAPTLSGNGELDITGSLSSTLQAPTLAAQGALPIAGALAATLSAPSLSAAGALQIEGQLGATLPAPALSSSGLLPIAGQLSATLPAPTLAATGQFDDEPIEGSLAATLPAPALSAAATLRIAGELGASLPAPTLSAGGALRISGDASAVLPAPALVATGELVSGDNTGSLSAVLPAPQLAAVASLAIAGQLSLTLPPPTLVAAGLVPGQLEQPLSGANSARVHGASGGVSSDAGVSGAGSGRLYGGNGGYIQEGG